MPVIEGSIPNETINGDGYFTGFGRHPDANQPITVNEWLDKLAPKATIVLAVGTCATYGGVHAMAGNPTGAMGVPDYLAGTGSPRPASRSFVCPAARRTRTISLRRFCICSTRSSVRHR